MLPPDVLELLRQWWKERTTHFDASVAPEQCYLFPGRGSRKPLSTRQFARVFQETVTSHSLRYSFAKHLLERGVGI